MTRFFIGQTQVSEEVYTKYLLSLGSSYSVKQNPIRNAVGAAFRIAAATMKGEKVIVSASEIAQRMTICGGCEFFLDKPVQHCLKCGCALNLKTRLETEHCPINKW